MRRTLWILPALLALPACSGEAPEAPQPEAPAGEQSLFKAEVAPLLAARCATCHLTGAEAGNLSMIPARTIESLVGVKAKGASKLVRVVPGDPDNSYLMMKLEGTHVEHGGTGAKMPFGAPPLKPEQIDLIRQWIAEGAKP